MIKVLLNTDPCKRPTIDQLLQIITNLQNLQKVHKLDTIHHSLKLAEMRINHKAGTTKLKSPEKASPEKEDKFEFNFEAFEAGDPSEMRQKMDTDWARWDQMDDDPSLPNGDAARL